MMSRIGKKKRCVNCNQYYPSFIERNVCNDCLDKKLRGEQREK